eukprot:TRINITY_DN17303_c0_g1_i2.p3 TRINITY_DN17303_c0_g1~~TRINITY_DN17303_c0_g1_i2.p3  ORF type:complete len:118 (-),score=0.38 TRINITY_DN17303_c0_g1_i2:216-569(-)
MLIIVFFSFLLIQLLYVYDKRTTGDQMRIQATVLKLIKKISSLLVLGKYVVNRWDQEYVLLVQGLNLLYGIIITADVLQQIEKKGQFVKRYVFHKYLAKLVVHNCITLQNQSIVCCV